MKPILTPPAAQASSSNPQQSRRVVRLPNLAEEKTKPADPPLPFINIGAWQDQPVPERVWTVKDRIPRNNVTLLSGEGSIGKSILSLHLATAIVLGKDWLQSLPDPGPAIVVCCEDDVSEIWRRLDLIFQHFGAAYTEFKDLHVLALAGEDALMATPDRNGLMQPTKLFNRIQQAACDIKPRLVVLDNSADIFGGNENDRAQVRQFIGILRGMAISASTGVLLTSHPSLTGISSGTGLSGSTAWNASVRSRLFFKRATTDKDEEPDPDLRVLEVMKANYGRPGETITLKWQNGLFLPVGGRSNLEKLAAEQAAKHLFLSLLNRFTIQNRTLSEKPSANNYAPANFAKEKEAREASIRKAAFETAMRDLFATDQIRVENYGSPSRGTSKLVAK
jgi:RecA-family ATPase